MCQLLFVNIVSIFTKMIRKKCFPDHDYGNDGDDDNDDDNCYAGIGVCGVYNDDDDDKECTNAGIVTHSEDTSRM